MGVKAELGSYWPGMVDKQIHCGPVELAVSAGHSGAHVLNAVGYKGLMPKLSQGSVLARQAKPRCPNLRRQTESGSQGQEPKWAE